MKDRCHVLAFFSFDVSRSQPFFDFAGFLFDRLSINEHQRICSLFSLFQLLNNI
jgi:hypothetical protein